MKCLLVCGAIVSTLATLCAVSNAAAVGRQHFAPAVNDLCRQEALAAQSRLATLRPPSAQAAKDLAAERMSPGAMRFLGDFASALLVIGSPMMTKLTHLDLVRAEEPMRQTYLKANSRVRIALRSLIAATGRRDAMGAAIAYSRLKTASARVSRLNVELRLTACGSEQSPAIHG